MAVALVHAYRDTSPQAPSENSQFIAIAQLDEGESAQIERDVRDVNLAAASVHILECTIDNRNELLSSLINVGSYYFSGEIEQQGAMNALSSLISRKILNLCASFRSYLDHQDTYIVRTFGRKSREYIEYKQELKYICDASPQYLFLYELRNFVQHVDMPPLHLSVRSSDHDKVSISVDLIRNRLLTETVRWSRLTRSFIQAQSEYISVWSMIQEWDRAFWTICRRIEKIRIVPVAEAAERILTLRATYEVAKDGLIGISTMPWQENETGGISIKINWIDEALARIILDISRYQYTEYDDFDLEG